MGTHYLTGAERDGPYRLDREEFLAGDPEDPLYAGRVVEHRGGWWFMGWHVRDRAGAFRGELGDPIAVEPAADGGLCLLWVVPFGARPIGQGGYPRRRGAPGFGGSRLNRRSAP